MLIRVECQCGRRLFARPEFAGTRAECPDCGRVLNIPRPDPFQTIDAPDSPPQPVRRPPRHEAVEIDEFLDPPVQSPPVPTQPPVTWQSVVTALLDPRSIQWMLVFGGGICVLGLVIYLNSLGLFENPIVLASVLIGSTLAVMGAGWAVALKTPYRMAGQALTFLACVVAPLNLWFLHAQNLVTLSGPLWVGALVCSLLYVGTVILLRDPLFLYAVEAGVTLMVVLFLYSLGLSVDSAHVSLTFVALGILSILSERSFPPDGEFNRQRYGLPAFWSGHLQMVVGLLTLLGTQFWPALTELLEPGYGWPGNLLTQSRLLPTGIWIAAAGAYLYSDIVVRKLGAYTYAAAFCLLAAVLTFGLHLPSEVIIILLSVLGLMVNTVNTAAENRDERWRRALPPLALVLLAVPVFFGVTIHWQATSSAAKQLGWVRDTGWPFVLAMLTSAFCTRVSAWLSRHRQIEWSMAYFGLSAASAVVCLVAVLRLVGLMLWIEQAPLLMLLPLGYLIAAWLWRGHTPEQPLGWAAHATTVLVLLGLFGSAIENTATRWVADGKAHLLYGTVLAEAAVFYGLAAAVRRRSVNVYFAAAAACLSLWQFLSFYNLPEALFTALYAVLGGSLLVTSRVIGLGAATVYDRDGNPREVFRGKGAALLRSGNAILLVAVLCAFFQGLARLMVGENEPLHLTAQIVTAVVVGFAAMVSPQAGWRHGHTVGAIAVGGIAFLTLMLRIPLTPWQKLEIFLVGIGVILVIAGYVGRFRETRPDDGTSMALWMGSLLTTGPLFIATLGHRLQGTGISLVDELGLVTVCLLLLVTGVAFQVKASTVLGGIAFSLYVLMLIVTLGWQQQWAVGAYLAIGGGLIFLIGLGLSLYRDRLLTLPERMANREGVFRILNWR